MSDSNKERFTEGRVEGYTCPNGKTQAIFHDEDVPGLGVRVTAAGAKSYIFEGKLHKKNVRLTIGPTGAKGWALGKAREHARALRVMLDKGVDPREVEQAEADAARARRVESQRKTATLDELWKAYMAAPHPRWGERSRKDHEALATPGGVPYKRGKGTTQPGLLYPLLSTRLVDLSADRVTEWMTSINSKSRAALAFRLLRAALRWAAGRSEYAGLIDERAWNSRTVRDAVPRIKPKQGDSLQREQLPAWFRGVQRAYNPAMAAYLQVLLLTGARREEVGGVRWADVDFQWKTLHLSDKVEGSRTIPLTPYVAKLMASLPRRNEWVFAADRGKTGHVTDPGRAHDTALEAEGLPHITLHGLRRSFGTLAEWVEVPVGVVAQIQGHKPSALAEKHYRRRPIDLLRVWHTKLEQWILEQGNVAFAYTDAEVAGPRLRVVGAD